jgi:hypothetical protein
MAQMIMSIVNLLDNKSKCKYGYKLLHLKKMILVSFFVPEIIYVTVEYTFSLDIYSSSTYYSRRNKRKYLYIVYKYDEFKDISMYTDFAVYCLFDVAFVRSLSLFPTYVVKYFSLLYRHFSFGTII